MSTCRVWSPLGSYGSYSTHGAYLLKAISSRHRATTLTLVRRPSGMRLSITYVRAISSSRSSTTPSSMNQSSSLALTKPMTTRVDNSATLTTPEVALVHQDMNPTFAHLPPYQLPTQGILSIFPRCCVPYLELSRIDRTNGFYGFYVSYLIGMGWAASISPVMLSLPEIGSVGAIFGVWTVWHRGAVCTINDIFDRTYDHQVERTRLRPLARKAVPVRNAWIWYWAQVATSAGVVSLMPHALACFYQAAPIVFLLSVYPLFKRWTNFPQVVLAVPLSWAILLSCSALGIDPWTMQSTAVTAASMCLFGSETTRLVVLDYVNACQDTVDDVKAGVKSMAVKYWNTSRFIATMGSIQVSFLIAAGVLAELSPVYFAVGVGGNIAMISWMVKTVDRGKPKVCAWWFQRGSILIGGMTALALYLEYVSRMVRGTTNSSQNDLAAERILTLAKH